MTWLRLDDDFADDPDHAALSDRAFRANVEGACYSAKHLTDGRVPRAVAARLAPPKARGELAGSGLWLPEEHDYLIVDPKLHIMSRREVEQRREQRSAAGKRGGERHAKRAAERDGDDTLSGPLDDSPNGERTRIQPRTREPVPEPEVQDLAFRALQNGSSGVGGVGGDPSSWADLLPVEIIQSQARYLLGKFAVQHSAWRDLVTAAHYGGHLAAALVPTYEEHPVHFTEALMRADDLGPGTIENPVGWLRSMVRKLAEEGA